MSSSARAYVCITYVKTKRKFPWEHHVVWNGKMYKLKRSNTPSNVSNCLKRSCFCAFRYLAWNADKVGIWLIHIKYNKTKNQAPTTFACLMERLMTHKFHFSSYLRQTHLSLTLTSDPGPLPLLREKRKERSWERGCTNSFLSRCWRLGKVTQCSSFRMNLGGFPFDWTLRPDRAIGKTTSTTPSN